jgi:hypothetical protein
MDAGTALVLVLLLACPLMMFWMHGRGHRGHGAHGGQGDDSLPRPATLEELRQVREDIDARIAELEEREAGGRELVEAGALSQNGPA